MTDRLSHPLRSDTSDNRERILDGARALFATEGLTVPVREIARHAGVGPATLYRRFPTEQTLATEALTDEMRACRAIVDEERAAPDPRRGFCLVIEKTCELHARSRGCTELQAFQASPQHSPLPPVARLAPAAPRGITSMEGRA
ncbi:TetR/AcrR family transcriptional regulator [Streptomyces antioxidans]|uniref:TetR/AcrR family transcriptional regulator n=1 Tax=Streptomyces TaxID=1883 RepID=UPI0006149387|nr:helix-turn-helix domain-containing protein [Streptomyces antioxidans]